MAEEHEAHELLWRIVKRGIHNVDYARAFANPSAAIRGGYYHLYLDAALLRELLAYADKHAWEKE